MSGALDLPGGLKGADADTLAALIAEIAGTPPRDQPWTAPALLFAAPAVARALPLPDAGSDRVLVHEYQRIERSGTLPRDTALTATASATEGATGTEFEFGLSAGGQSVSLGTALRVFTLEDLAAARPTSIREAMLKGATTTGTLTVTPDQTLRYVTLAGDTNPIHRDPAAAAPLGLSAPVVPGMLLLALVQPVAEAACPGRTLARMTCRFMSPLETGAPFRIAVVPRGPDRARAFLLADGSRGLGIADLQFAG